MLKNPLLDVDFLTKLTLFRHREVYARIAALTLNELPIEYIEGKVTGGSIRVDGNSAVRRTCSLTMVAQDININDFYWGLKNKFKLEIGLKNMVDPSYPDIIWFKQGLFIINSFNTSQSTNNFTINISGKDKMCLLNGDLAGALPHSVDFGIEEFYDKTTGVTTYTPIPVKRIIREAVQNFGNELAQNIVINDIEDAGLELLEYRGDRPIYMFRSIDSDEFINMTLNGNQPCYINGNETTISDSRIIYDNLVETDIDQQNISTPIQLDPESGKYYYIAKFTYGSIPGYRLTDLTYAGDLIANVGETLTSVLDKIKNMLGEFEYFYDIDGKFIFQRKKNYVQSIWTSLEKNEDEAYANAALANQAFTFSFIDGTLVTAFQNTPNLLNLRNDYAVWGKKKTPGGIELPIHARYAIDNKPTHYTSIAWYENDGETIKKPEEEFTTENWDWRELIYRMALDYRQNYHRDDFIYELTKANPEFIGGRTGYEQYYTDLEGFWRELYNPEPERQYELIDHNEAPNVDNLYIQYAYRKATEEELQTIDYEDLYVIYNDNIYPFLEGYCHLTPGEVYYYVTADGSMNAGSSDPSMLNQIDIKDLYVRNIIQHSTQDNKLLYTKDNLPFHVCLTTADESIYEGYTLFIDKCFSLIDKSLLYVKDKSYVKFTDLELQIQRIYKPDLEFKEYLSYNTMDNYGNIPTNVETIVNFVYYFNGYYNFYTDSTTGNYWSKDAINNPENLLFWFDFLEAEGSELAKYAVPVVGSRTKAINDTDVKTIYYRDIPTTIFQTGQEVYEHQPGYTYIQLQGTMENLFTISSKGKSAKERIDELLYNHSYCIESSNITTIPVYHLEPNTRIWVEDKNSKISGEYIVSSLTIPLTYNGTMSITATKAISNLK